MGRIGSTTFPETYGCRFMEDNEQNIGLDNEHACYIGFPELYTRITYDSLAGVATSSYSPNGRKASGNKPVRSFARVILRR